MTTTFRHLVSIVCVMCLACMSVAAHATHTKAHKTAKTQSTNKAPAKAASKSRKPAPKSSVGKKTVVTVDRSCKSVRVKTAKGYRTQRKCTTGDSALVSPIGAGDINTQTGSGKSDLKARTIPDRAYAVDGYTFFHQGRKYRVIGINEQLIPAGSDLAKQRLQLALDSGTISVEPETVDDSGTMRAMVRVAGKNLADVLNASR